MEHKEYFDAYAAAQAKQQQQEAEGDKSTLLSQDISGLKTQL